MAIISGEMLNELSTWEELRFFLASQFIVDVYKGDCDKLLTPGKSWVESATSTNLPSGATKGFITTELAIVAGNKVRVQTFNGTDGSASVFSTRFKPGSPADAAPWQSWS